MREGIAICKKKPKQKAVSFYPWLCMAKSPSFQLQMMWMFFWKLPCWVRNQTQLDYLKNIDISDPKLILPKQYANRDVSASLCHKGYFMYCYVFKNYEIYVKGS